MKFRKATKKDLGKIAEIFRIESAKPPYNKKKTSKKALAGIKKDFKDNDLFVAIIEGKIVGFIMIRKDSDIKNRRWINELWILKNYQRKGIGREMMNKIEGMYKKKNIKTLGLAAYTRKGGAVDFYKKLNYKVDNRVVSMTKKLK